MLVSILHRATGVTMATVGVIIFVWWLYAASSGLEAYDLFYKYVINAGSASGLPAVTTVIVKLAAITLTWVFFQHMASGVRHLVMDIGSGFELRTNRLFAKLTMAFSTVSTALVWGWALLR